MNFPRALEIEPNFVPVINIEAPGIGDWVEVFTIVPVRIPEDVESNCWLNTEDIRKIKKSAHRRENLFKKIIVIQ